MRAPSLRSKKFTHTSQWRASWTGIRFFGCLRWYFISVYYFGRTGFYVCTPPLLCVFFEADKDLLQGRLLPAVNTIGSQCSLLPLAGIFLAILQVRAALLPIGQLDELTLLIISGWLTVAGWQALVASGAFLCATLIQALIILNHPSYNFHAWHATLIFWAVLVVAVLVNTVVSSMLPKIEGLILILHVLGFFAVLIPLVYMSPSKGTPKDVFTVFLNQGGWSSQGLSFFIGLMGSVFSFLGIFSPLPNLDIA